jgi:hypothetical protein
VQMGPDRNLVLESRGLLEGQLEKVGAKFGSQGGCNSSVVVRAAHVLSFYLQIGRRDARGGAEAIVCPQEQLQIARRWA